MNKITKYWNKTFYQGIKSLNAGTEQFTQEKHQEIFIQIDLHLLFLAPITLTIFPRRDSRISKVPALTSVSRVSQVSPCTSGELHHADTRVDSPLLQTDSGQSRDDAEDAEPGETAEEDHHIGRGVRVLR